jgi:transposase InsO family protein
MALTGVSEVQVKLSFVQRATQPDANISALCREFGVSRSQAYVLLARFAQEGQAGLLAKSRRPHHSPTQIAQPMQQRIVELRQCHPAWGARKLHAYLLAQGVPDLPSISAVQAVLRRAQLIDPAQSPKHRAFERFEHPNPHDLWQMDFKGYVLLQDGQQLHPLTILDDHSRYSLRIGVCANERRSTVQAELTAAFQEHGMPLRMTMDNGSPWGDPHGAFTKFALWLMRLGVQVSHSRPYHPQTQGKDERFHRSLKAELLSRQVFESFAQAKQAIEQWRHLYNELRPHQALAMQPPSSRYAPSPRAYTGHLAPLLYPVDDAVRKVCELGFVSFKGHNYRLGKAFAGERVGIRPAPHQDGLHDVFYSTFRVAQINLHQRSIESHRKMMRQTT